MAKSQKAETGERMIQISVRLWTNNIAKGKGKVLPKHAWSNGVIRLESNKTHGIKAKNPITFNSLLELTYAIEKVLLLHNIKLHTSRKMRKYFTDKK
ncbi:MAG: hypothetical protein Q7W05_12020 [Deltaproteobacteria bacterium]|nr:hypothetical protein [Deltaproteobacteria bacterium]